MTGRASLVLLSLLLYDILSIVHMFKITFPKTSNVIVLDEKAEQW